MSSGIFEAYLVGRAGAFFDGHFASVEDRDRVRARAGRPLAPRLADALDAQNARYGPNPRRAAHLRALRCGAAAVVTGQQVGLFLGPLYTLYKAASAIRLARELAADWDAPVVPVFWLQTEDHDLAEIASCHVARASGGPLHLALPAPDDHVSIAHRVLPAEITACLEQLGEALRPLPHAEEHLARLARHYRPGAGFGEAFAGVLAELFAEEGLVILDPRDPALAPLAAPVHERALLAAQPIARALLERGHALEAAGYPVGVHVREAAPLSFFHPAGPAGPRYRLAADGDDLVEVGGTGRHTRAALLDALARDPGCFSTSALLRPVLQDTWLPTVAYVGGPGEIAYFAQLAPVYALFALSMPLVVPRTRLRLLEDKPRRLLARLGLGADDVCHPVEEVLARARAEREGEPGGEALSRRLLETFDATMSELTPSLAGAGRPLDRALGRTRAAVAKAVERLGRTYDKALLYQDETLVEQIVRLRGAIFPDDQPQERYYGCSSFAARYGEQAFVSRVLAAAEPFVVAPQDVEL